MRAFETVEITAYIPRCMLPLVRLISSFMAYIPNDKESLISNLIEDGKFDEAQAVIDEVVKETGQTPFTVRLETRMYRIMLLGK